MTEPIELEALERLIDQRLAVAMAPKPKRTNPLAADARNRALRSFIQGLLIDIAVGVAVVIYTFTDGPNADVAWKVMVATVAKTVLHSGAAYVMRRLIDPSRVPTPVPPEYPGEPAD